MTSVTIITVTLDAAGILPGCLQSVADQGIPELQHLVIDGGSTDGTLEVLRSWTGHPLEWSSGPDAGISDAFNKGIAQAHGDLIGILNADDRYAAGALTRALNAMSQHPEAGFCFGHCLHVESGGRQWLNRSNPRYREHLRYFMPDVNHPTMVIRRSVYEDVGGYGLQWRLAMDYDWLCRAEAAGVYGTMIDAVQATMAMGGRSDLRWRKAYAEARDIAISHGAPAWRAHVDYAARIVKGSIRRTLNVLGLEPIARKVRRWRQDWILGRPASP